METTTSCTQKRIRGREAIAAEAETGRAWRRACTGMGDACDPGNTELAEGCHAPPNAGTARIQVRGVLFKRKGTADSHLPGPRQPPGRNRGVKREEASKTWRMWLGKGERAEPQGSTGPKHPRVLTTHSAELFQTHSLYC